jgi:hypothetical protein
VNWVITLTDEKEYRSDWVTKIIGPFASEAEADKYVFDVLPHTKFANKNNWDVVELEAV